ncbi:hypothetical protein ACNA6I_23135 (plasmid) [Rossellomorea sp. FS2]|uniref:hypothetical protein n=1 Tax=Rossellomorea sp. FS2 TaxID=3391447 RepID=UPI003A4D4768
MRGLKVFFGTIASVLLGILFLGAIDLDDIKYKKNINKLKKENWFKELADNGVYYSKFHDDPVVREFLMKENIVKDMKEDERKREEFEKLLKS